jgi:hypothetical protein
VVENEEFQKELHCNDVATCWNIAKGHSGLSFEFNLQVHLRRRSKQWRGIDVHVLNQSNVNRTKVQSMMVERNGISIDMTAM